MVYFSRVCTVQHKPVTDTWKVLVTSESIPRKNEVRPSFWRCTARQCYWQGRRRMTLLYHCIVMLSLWACFDSQEMVAQYQCDIANETNGHSEWLLSTEAHNIDQSKWQSEHFGPCNKLARRPIRVKVASGSWPFFQYSARLDERSTNSFIHGSGYFDSFFTWITL